MRAASRVAAVLWAALLCGGMLGCYSAHPDVKIDEIVRIFMRDPGSYSLMIRDPATGVMRMKDLDKAYPQETIFIPDAPEKGAMWLVIKEKIEEDRRKTTLEFHVHSERDVEGGGWNHGKGGHGQTNVVR